MVLRRAVLYADIKAVFSCWLMLVSIASPAQKLRLNGYDKYEKKWRMETVAENLKSSDDSKMDIAFGAADTSLFLQLSGTGVGSNTVGVGNQVIFLFDDDSSVTATSQSLQALDYNKLPLTYRHEFSLRADDLEGLTRHRLKALRKYSLGGFDDIYIESKNAASLRDLSSFFIGELKKRKLLPEKPAVLVPAFPGGKEALLQFLNRNVKSISVLQAGEKKTVVAQFSVAANGSISDWQIIPPSDPLLENEVLRLLKRMPKWKPALEKGQPVDFIVKQPLTFYKTDTSLNILF